MLDIGWTELVIVGIIALIVIGPRELPRTLRTIGQMMTKVRRMASEFQGQFNEAIREAELDELRKEAEKYTNLTNPLGDFDPLGSVKSEIESAVDLSDKPKPTKTETPAPAAVQAPASEAASPPEKRAEPEPAEPAPASDTAKPESGGGRAA